MACQNVARAASASQWEPPAIEVADIFRARGESYRKGRALSWEQRAAMRAIEACRTSVLGGHLDVCDACGFSRPAFNSCRNRHCPKCQGLAQAKWIEKRKERTLPTSYFHVVFTLPAQLRALARHNAETFYDLLFETVSRTLLKLGQDPNRLGAQMGFTAVLHTWSRNLQFHPHIHCIVTGGGLSPDGDRWVAIRRPKYLFPVKVLGALFRGKFLERLSELYDRGELDLRGNCASLASPAVFHKLVDQLYNVKWVVYAKRPFGGPDQVYSYLGRYTHRIGISNRRLVSFDGETVCFRTKSGNTVIITAEEFIHRYLQHVLPSGFVKIRHYGLLAASNAKTKLIVARTLLETHFPTAAAATVTSSAASSDWREHFKQVTGVDLTVCPRCRIGKMVSHPLVSSQGLPDTS